MSVIINERGAKELWPGRDPIGQQVLWGKASAENPYCTVVGVVGNIRHHSGEENNGIELYYPYTQYPVSAIFYVLRTTAPDTVAAAVRDAVHSVDRNAAIVWTKPMDQIIDESLWQRKLWGVLFAAFAALALVLAVVGIYGVMSYMVSQRTREIGIRMALGAARDNVVVMDLRHGMKLALTGVAIGVLAALLLARTLRAMLWGVTANDPFTLASATGLLCLAALGACYLPARRAAGVDPLVALRQE
jgi:putative ABC transport system permease protein